MRARARARARLTMSLSERIWMKGHPQILTTSGSQDWQEHVGIRPGWLAGASAGWEAHMGLQAGYGAL